MAPEFEWIVKRNINPTSGRECTTITCPICKSTERILSGAPDRCYICGIPLKFNNLISNCNK